MSENKDLILLGATGSIGTQVLEVVKNTNIKIKTIACGKNIAKAIDIIESHNIEYVSMSEEKDALELKRLFPYLEVGYGEQGLIKAVTEYSGDVCNAITGIAGLRPTIEAIKRKKNIYLANKETLVVAGDLIMNLAKKNNIKIVPIDSEHNAIYRLIHSVNEKEVAKVIITASGGAFRDKTREELEGVTVKEALAHPNWSMGKKITVDCATMVNKGLEVMEAHHLFGLDYDRITTVIHPESIIHSMVEYNDNSVSSLMYNPSMIIPIQYAILNEITVSPIKEIDFSKLSKLTFREMDFNRFPMIKLAYEVGKKGGLLPTVYNASNEVAVGLFLEGKIKFLEIEKIIERAVNGFKKDIVNITFEDIINTDKAIKMQILKEVK